MIKKQMNYKLFNKTGDDNIYNHFILFLRMYSDSKDVFEDIFYDTFKFFWPFYIIHANLSIVSDDKNPN